MPEHIMFVLPLAEAELLYECLTELAEAKLDEAEDEHDKAVATALDGIADTIHSGLHGSGAGEG
jgi:hypothetical protein